MGEEKEIMHLKSVKLDPTKYPVKDRYPFNLPIFQQAEKIEFHSPVTFFLGENGTGKSTLLRGICHRCDIHVWRYNERRRIESNPYEEKLYEAVDIEWANGAVPGSIFSSQTFQDFAQIVDEWAAAGPEVLDYFGGKSLLTQSHGQSILSYFGARYKIKGLYLMDEPEMALSPKSQLKLLELIKAMSQAGHAQFIIATHSPIISSCPDAEIYSFDDTPIRQIAYEETEHYRIYRDFMIHRDKYLHDRCAKKGVHPNR